MGRHSLEFSKAVKFILSKSRLSRMYERRACFSKVYLKPLVES